MDWTDLSYLQNGNEKQQYVFTLLQETNIMNILSKYQPIVVGTIPIGLDIEESDIDIICEAKDIRALKQNLEKEFDTYHSFSIHLKPYESVCSSFVYKKFKFEIFAENKEVKFQNAYRHMLIEYRIIKLGGTKVVQKIMELRKKGLKTEPAFARLLGIKGNPYQGLLSYEEKSDLVIQKELELVE